MRFGDRAAISFTQNSDSRLTAVAPAHADGTVDVRVETPGGTSDASADDRFTFVGPRIQAVFPSTGPARGGRLIEIYGADFGASPSVDFGEASAKIIASGATWAWVKLPPGSGTEVVSVSTPDGVARATFTYYDYPTIDGIEPSEGRSSGGFSATVTGDNFAPGLVVHFGSATAVADVRSPTKAVVTVPAAPPGSDSSTIDVTVSGATPTPAGAGGRTGFTYWPGYCLTKCVSAWVTGSATSDSLELTDGMKTSELAPVATQTMPEQWKDAVCSASSILDCKRFSGGPVAIHLPVSSYKGDASSQVFTDGSTGLLDLRASTQGTPPDDSGNFSGWISKGSSASGEFVGGNSFALDPQPTKPIAVAVIVTVNVRTNVSDSARNGSGTTATAAWQIFLDHGVATGSESKGSVEPWEYSSYDQTVTSSATLRGKTLPGGASQRIVIPEVLSDPSQWAVVGYTFEGRGSTIAPDCPGNFLCTAESTVSVDPVIVPLTPGYRLTPLTPLRALRVPTVESASAVDGPAGSVLRLTGARFGSERGQVVVASGDRQVPVDARSWSDHAVTLRVPLLAAGTVWVTLHTARGGTTNAYPFTITRGRGQLPVVTSLAPASGKPGTRVTLRGIGLAHVSAVRFGSHPARLVRTSGALIVIAPSGRGAVPVSVVTPSGRSVPTATAVFHYTAR